MHVNVVKGIRETFGAKSFMGRTAIPLRQFADRPGETVEDWYDLGKGEWANEDGTVRARPLACLLPSARLRVHAVSACLVHSRCGGTR
jgi:hypothetical protein